MTSKNRARRKGIFKTVAAKVSRGDLKLLLAEVGQYFQQVKKYLAVPHVSSEEDLRHKLAYIDSLSLTLRNQNFDLECNPTANECDRRYFHSLASITTHLYHLCELGFNAARQLGHLSQPDFLEAYELNDFFKEIEIGLNLIGPALEQGKLKMAVKLCRVEGRLDDHYTRRFRQVIEELDSGCGQPGNRVTTIMVIHYLERIGDLFLEIGEEILYIILGENIKFSQYQALDEGLKEAIDNGQDFDSLWTFHAIYGGRSGCSIGVVDSDKREFGGEPVIFKHGPVAKMEKEKENLMAWAELWPGLPPAVRAFVPAKGEGEAGLVLEYIPGHTLKDLFMDQARAREAFSELARSLHLMASLWKETLVESETRADFVRQTEKRMGPVHALYPELMNFSGGFGGLKIKSLDALLHQAGKMEELLPAPFAVRIHGDFNLSNIMLDSRTGDFRFIDLNRSRLSDYVQDISVMILSILRLPLRDAAARARLSSAARLVHTFALDFAASMGDATCPARLAFGLARSYLTSARFEPRQAAAARFIGYSRYLWEKLVAYGNSGAPWEQFRLDKRVLYI